jgi:rhamnulose-1-phosphate aldolase
MTTKRIFENKKLQELLHDVAELASYLWQKGWAERNAGNISVNLCDILPGVEIHNLEKLPSFKLQKVYPELAGTFFYVTGTGRRMRDLARNPMTNACIIHISWDGSSYYILSQNDSSMYEMRPTSELAAHMAIHQEMIRKSSKNRVIIHSHPNELIALTHSPIYKNEDVLNRILWGMQPETTLIVPKGVGVVPYEVPGTVEIADQTIKALEKHDVLIWEKHGCMAVGEEVFATFDLIDTLTKSAQVFFLCKSAGFEPEGLSEIQFRELKKHYGIDDF